MLHTRIAVPPPEPAARERAQRPAGALRERLAASVSAGDYRAEALWKTAPWLAVLSIACALSVVYALFDTLPLTWLGGWLSLLLVVNLVMVRARRRASGYGPVSLFRSVHWTLLEVALHAGLWVALPFLAFLHAPASAQLQLGAALGTMMAGAFLLVLVPLAATLWAVVLGCALLLGLHGSAAAFTGLWLLLLVYLGTIVIGCITLERLLAGQMRIAAGARAERETIGMLLREYEEQGAGWLWQTDAADRLTYASPRVSEMLGRATGRIVGQPLPSLLGGHGELGAALAARAPFSGLVVEVPTVAGPRWISLAGNPVGDGEGDHAGFRGVGSDITEARRSQDRLTHMASIDVLTGLANRQRMRELFAQAIGQAERTATHCAILFLDLDGFKPVNDTFGHPVGDAVLRTAAQRLARETEGHGHVGRIGGDEFAVVLHEGHSRGAVEALGQRLIRAIAEPFPFEATEIRIGVSIGCAFAPLDGSTVDELLLKADLALYQAKSKGRGTFLHFDAAMQRAVEDRARLEQDLRQALARKQFQVQYQPIVSARTQAVVGFEALLRWRHPERGLVPPLEFIPIAEENGLIAEIGEWVIRTACQDARRWPEHIFVSVNLSARQLHIPALPNAVSEALAASRLQPGRLELEVTESVFMSDADGSLDVLRRVRSLGVGIALDDFGTGYSSLGYLNKTIFHTLKIDGSFVQDAARKSETVSIIRAIVALANSFRMTITAEGVETVADFERMQALGCHKIQGFLFGRPVPFEETLELVGARWDFGRKAG